MNKKSIKKSNLKKEKPEFNRTSIKLIIKDQKAKSFEKQLDVITKSCKSQSIIIVDLLKEFNCPILLVVEHIYLQTQLDLTGVSNHVIFSFEEDGKFIGASLLGENDASSVQFLNLGRLILIAPLKMNLTSHSIIQIKY
jgi:hypothetical protein